MAKPKKKKGGRQPAPKPKPKEKPAEEHEEPAKLSDEEGEES